MGYDEKYFKEWYLKNREKVSERQKTYNKKFVEKNGVSRYMYNKIQERNKKIEKNKLFLKTRSENNKDLIKKKNKKIILYFD
jgi:uncharacterized NAD(P)/FAD-binding protein YdhS